MSESDPKGSDKTDKKAAKAVETTVRVGLNLYKKIVSAFDETKGETKSPESSEIKESQSSLSQSSLSQSSLSQSEGMKYLTKVCQLISDPEISKDIGEVFSSFKDYFRQDPPTQPKPEEEIMSPEEEIMSPEEEIMSPEGETLLPEGETLLPEGRDVDDNLLI